MSEPPVRWDHVPEEKRHRRMRHGQKPGERSGIKSPKPALAIDPRTPTDQELWFNPDVHEHDDTARLDDQEPATLYYLGRIVEIAAVEEVYVQHKDDGEKAHWAVIEERDFEVMDEIYDIEMDTREKFPYADVEFRVTVSSHEGPSVADRVMKIYSAE